MTKPRCTCGTDRINRSCPAVRAGGYPAPHHDTCPRSDHVSIPVAYATDIEARDRFELRHPTKGGQR